MNDIVKQLRQENEELRAEITSLKNETARLEEANRQFAEAAEENIPPGFAIRPATVDLGY